MGFCGDRSVLGGHFQLTECLADILGLIPAGFLLVIVAPNALLRWIKVQSPCDVTNTLKWVRFPANSLRWIMSLALISVYVLEISEGIISELSSSGTNVNFYVPQTIHLLACIFTLVFYNFVESYNLGQFLVCLLLYWGGMVICKVVKLLGLYWEGIDHTYARLDITWLILVITTILFTIDVYVLCTQRYLMKNGVKLKPADELNQVTYVHPYTDFFSHMTWGWLNTTLARGYKHPLQLKDLGAMPKTEHSRENFERFKQIFQEERARVSGTEDQPSLWRCYWRAYWPLLSLAAIFKLLADCLIFVGPMCLDGMVNYVINTIEKNETNATALQGIHHVKVGEFLSNGYVLALISLVAMLLQGTLWQNNFYICVRQGIRLKAALQALVFDKTLKLSLWGMGERGMTQGQVMNHMSVDPMHLCMFFYFGHFTWSLPLQVALTFVLLYIQLGTSSLFSAILLLLLVPFQYYIGEKLARLQKKALEQADTRLKKSNELLQSIKLLKLYAWEVIFRRSIEETRRKELSFLLKIACCRIISIFITDGAPLAATMITFSVYPYIENQPLKASKVFSSLALFNILGLPLYLVTMLINIVTHAKVSTDRLLPFFLAPEVEAETRDNSIQQPALVPDVKMKLPNDVKTTNNPVPSIKIEDTDKVTEPLLPTQTLSPEDTPTNANDLTKPPPEDSSNMNGSVPEDSSNMNGSVVNAREDEVESTLEETESVLVIENGHFSWDLDGSNPVLRDINVIIPKGRMTVVVGQVGSGKSSLLSAMFGEMTTIKGKLTWKRGYSVAYGGQKAWLMNATLRDNIIFGRDYDIKRYEKILDVCALRQDMCVLPAGDKTEIGEKGINLSGGQKQRVSIARALYSDADIVILDDPFSALDVHVGSHIFQEAIQDYLLKQNKTVVVVTHHLQYLPHAHQVIVMNNGYISHKGTLESIRQRNPELYEVWRNSIEHTKKELERQKQAGESISEIDGQPMLEKPSSPLLGASRSALSALSLSHLWDEGQVTSKCSIISLNMSAISPDVAEECLETKKTKLGEEGRLIEEEERLKGSVKAKVYLSYAKSGTALLSLMTVVGYMLRQGVRMGTDFWLAEWSEQAKVANDQASHVIQYNYSAPYNTTTELSGFNLEYWVSGYMILCSVGIILGLFAVIFLELMCLTAARNLHQKMMTNLSRAPMRFFDTTPMGRIINRMSGDTNIIDEKMPVTVDGVLFCFVYVMGGLIVNAISTPAFIIPSVPMFLVYFAVQRYYISSSREMQRLDSITKSPILAHFSETLGGLATIRAYKDQQRFQERNWRGIDENNTAYLYLQTANVWMGIRLDYLGAFIVCTASVCSVTSGIYGYVKPGVVGLAIAYAIMISGFVNWLMRMVSEAEMYFTSVERVAHFSTVETEPKPSVHDTVPGSFWPSKGEIDFDNVSLRYDASLDPVIKNLNLHIKGGEKIGICGRTGSGKSSLTLGLFRIIDICSGKLVIDGIDISSISLDTLRSKLSIIPQDPVLFEGSIRYNLDPDKTRSDDDVWKALEIAQLKTTITSMPDTLDSSVTEGGENFSVGQRQLFCLARAFLRNSQILILDEATASIDMATDTVIQSVIQHAFVDKTVITIAHRMGTILNCDTVLVLQEGQIVEHDTPQKLLSSDSKFAEMIKESKN